MIILYVKFQSEKIVTFISIDTDIDIDTLNRCL